MSKGSQLPEFVKEAVLLRSESLEGLRPIVSGYDFCNGVDYHKMFASYACTGFQATNVGKAFEEINKMITCKLAPVPDDESGRTTLGLSSRKISNCTIFLSYTSNLVSAGTRETMRYLTQHNMVDCIVTSAGGVEEDFIKCLSNMYVGDFHLSGRELRSKGINRIGNLLVPNNNYCLFEDWLSPLLNVMLEEQMEEGILWTPSKIIHRLGKEIDNHDSIYYWAYKHNIPVFCPALTDGSIGDMIFFHSYRHPGLVMDIVEDIHQINSMAISSINSGIIILGGGVSKHHVCNANIMRNGADYAVYVSTATEFDGCDSGACPDEAISWGKIRSSADPVKLPRHTNYTNGLGFVDGPRGGGCAA